MKTEERCTCPGCGNELSGAIEFCPVCTLRKGLAGGVESGGSSFGEEVNPTPEQIAKRFEHYELVTGEDGKPVELGRGAMGVTYKAFDVDLRCPVALKVIGEKHLGNDLARLRFLREARAAASLRHPNVASVFHLGRTGQNYFYAMEFVEGETLEHLIKRSGRLDVLLALEITSQVAAGLAAVHKQNLVHRDIKPTNIMVNFDGRGVGIVKIIDLGLAKALNESLAETMISTPGAFAGTPEFASPEQFLGIGVDIRSDLYSLGVTLWDMVTGQVPFRGTPADVMYQHRYKPPPMEQLQELPQPIGALLAVILEKNPGHRFQTPVELLNAIETVKQAIRAGRRMLQTICVHILASDDVQRERNLTDRLLHTIAAEFDLPVCQTEFNFQRLITSDLVAEAAGSPARERKESVRFVLCPCFSPVGAASDAIDLDEISRLAVFDIGICIVWSRLDAYTESILSPLSRGEANTRSDAGAALGPDNMAGDRETLISVVYRNSNTPHAPVEPKDERESFGRRWDALQEFFGAWERENPSGFAKSVNNYGSLQEFEDIFSKGFRRLLAGRVGEDSARSVARQRSPRWHTTPFRGLNPFSFEHSAIFHGRRKAIWEVLEAMEAQVRVDRPFVLVVGPSGSGKSSLVQAGVLPLLTQPGTIEGIGLWRRAVTRPGASGSGGDCFDALASALLEPTGLATLQNPESINGTRELANELREHVDSVAIRVRDALDHAAREWRIERRHYLEDQERQLRASGRLEVADVLRRQAESLELPKARLALVVDQLEELFTAGFSEGIRQSYVAAIAALARSGRVYLLATLRSDFYSSYQQFPELTELTKPSGKVDLRAPASREIGEIIRLPTEAAGLSFEDEKPSGNRLDEALRDAASATPESLPLLEHVLSLLYEEQAKRKDRLLRWSDYRELGELKGALAQHAERVFATLEAVEQAAFSVVMSHLITLGQGEEEVPNRRTVPYKDFIASEQSNAETKSAAKGFIDRFIQARLLVADTDPHGEITVSVAHEALLREWQRVREWVSENREFLRMRDRLDASIKLWLSRGRQTYDLLRPGLALAEGEKLASELGSSLSEQQTSYIRASIAERTRLKRAEERVRYSVMGGITAALVVAVVFGIVSFRQYRRAEKAKVATSQSAKRATLARNDAEKLINYMTIDLRDKLKPIGRLDLLSGVNEKVIDYYGSLGGENQSPEVLRQWSVALANSGDIQKDRGDLAAALKSYSESLAIRDRLVKQNPANNALRRYQALGLTSVGEILNLQGDSSKALEHFAEARNIVQDLLQREPGNVDLRHDLSVVQRDMGDVLEYRGDLIRALKSYQDCLSIRRELGKQQPDSSERENEVSLVLLQIGRVLSHEGRSVDAIASYRESLMILQRLANAEPNNALWQEKLSSSKEQLGYGLSAQGDLARALQMYLEALEIRTRLAGNDPSNSVWQGLLARSYSDLWDAYLSQGNLAEALENSQHALAIQVTLEKRDPSNAIVQRDLGIENGEVGKVLEMQGQLAGAREKFEASLFISRKLCTGDPDSAELQRDLSISLERVAAILSAEGDLSGALEKDLESLEIRKKLAERDAANAQWQNDLTWSYISVGDSFNAEKDRVNALKNYRIAQALERELVQRDPQTLELRSDLALTCQKVGDVLSAQGHQSEALDSYRECIDLTGYLVAKDQTNGEWASELALACYSAATMLPGTDSQMKSEARSLLERGRDTLLKLQSRSALSPIDSDHLRLIQAALGGL
jgi:serine/threonine protein kinase/tetratricopeptide (TPR) repeat protein